MTLINAEHLADAYEAVARVNHYLVGIVARFWADGLPEGPEYFAEYDWETADQIELAEAAD